MNSSCFLCIIVQLAAASSPAIAQKSPRCWKKDVRVECARLLQMIFFFRFESQIASRFCCIEIGSYRFIRRCCCWENASLLFYLLFFSFLVFFCCLSFWGFYFCFFPFRNGSQHNIALVAMHGSNYLLLMDIPSTTRSDLFYRVESFFFFLISFSISISSKVSLSLLFCRCWYFIDESRQSLKGVRMRWGTTERERRQHLNISDAPEEKEKRRKRKRIEALLLLPNNAFNGGHQ